MNFDEMNPQQKLEHVKKCMAEALVELKAANIHLADILDVWDYWVPYLIERLEKAESLVESFREEKASAEIKCEILRAALEKE